MTESDPLVRPLVETVVELALLLEASLDESDEPYGRAGMLDWIAFVFDRLSLEQRHRLAQVVAAIAADAEAGVRRELLTSFPLTFGLVDEEDNSE